MTVTKWPTRTLAWNRNFFSLYCSKFILHSSRPFSWSKIRLQPNVSARWMISICWIFDFNRNSILPEYLQPVSDHRFESSRMPRLVGSISLIFSEVMKVALWSVAAANYWTIYERTADEIYGQQDFPLQFHYSLTPVFCSSLSFWVDCSKKFLITSFCYWSIISPSAALVNAFASFKFSVHIAVHLFPVLGDFVGIVA